MFRFKFVYFRNLLILLLLSFFIFCFWQIYIYLKTKITTEVATAIKISKQFDVYGIIFKDEKILDSYDKNQVVKNLFKNGDRVAAKSEIAKKYSSENDIKNLDKIRKLDEKITSLEKIQNLSHTSNKNFISLNKQIYNNYFEMLNYLQQSNSNKSIEEIKNQIVNYFNQKQILMGKVKNFSNSIEKLNKEKILISNEISSNPQIITTPFSGYFVDKIDGLEKQCTLNSINDFDFDSLKKLYDSYESNLSNSNSGVKLIVNPNIYFKAFLPNSFSLDHNVGLNCCIKFTSIDEEIKAKLVEFNLGNDEKNSVATFEINNITPKLASLRKSKAEVNFHDYRGLKINRSAIRINEANQAGVYVLIGSKIKFKLVDILLENENFILSKFHNENRKYVQELDEVIVGGKNLYEKKLN